LTGFDISLAANGAGGSGVTFTVLADNAGIPGSVLVTLSGKGTFTSGESGNYTYSVTGGSVLLSAHTVY